MYESFFVIKMILMMPLLGMSTDIYASSYDEESTQPQENAYLYHVIRTVIISALADFLAQIIISDGYCSQRTCEFCVLAFVYVAPIMYLWHRYLINCFGTHSGAAFSKMICDQFIFKPISLVMYLILMGLTRGKTCEEAVEFMHDRYWGLLKNGFLVWPIFVLLNYSFVATHRQIFCRQIMGLFWTMYVSYMTHTNTE